MSYSLTVGWPFCPAWREERSQACDGIRITLLALGVLAIVSSSLLITEIFSVSNSFDFAAEVVGFSGGGILILTGFFVRCVQQHRVIDFNEIDGNIATFPNIFSQEELATYLNDLEYTSTNCPEFIGVGCTKHVFSLGNELVLKMYAMDYELIANEQSSYEIAQQLALDVVPPSLMFDLNQAKIRKPHIGKIISFYKEATLQKRILKREITTADFLAEVIKDKARTAQAQEVVLFNWLTGRSDRKRENSEIDQEGKVWEIDNDLFCSPSQESNPFDDREYRKDDPHWLLEGGFLEQLPLSEELVLKLKQLPDQVRMTHGCIKMLETPEIRQEDVIASNIRAMKTIIAYLEQEGTLITLHTIRTCDHYR